MGQLEDTADELAQLALADQERSGEEKVVDEIGEILGSSSQTLQEAYLTAVRVRRAEARARALLERRAQAAKRATAGKLTPPDDT
ncbi:hypothetical protein [Octadecabacter sp. R77987]|uniref:hypothetical protein n=1 Tax=Octadecabacter sp. R77987 TaxID=3093874 RepID=UPI00366EA337